MLRELIAQHSARLRRYVSRFTTDPDHIDELLQRTWVRVYERRASYRSDGPIVSWILRLCRTECVDHARRQQREARLRSLVLTSLDGLEGEPEALLDEQTNDIDVMDLVMALPHRERAVVIMRVIMGVSTVDTARALCCASGTVKAALSHAKRKLRAATEEGAVLVLICSSAAHALAEAMLPSAIAA
jgi:RNA polymerase sigma-70 factor (ECF subfamily)